MTRKTISIKDFWKPIEECPYAVDHYYFLRGDHIIIAAEWTANHYGEYCWCDTTGFCCVDIKVTHYAEIPPLPERGE